MGRKVGRPSKLNDDQWAEITARIAAGERQTDLAREFKVSKTAISTRVSKPADKVKTVAGQIFAAETGLADLTVSEQIMAVNLASRLRSISANLAGAADHGAATAHRLHALAAAQVATINASNLEKSGDRLKGAAALIRVGNEAAQPALTLVMTQKEQFKKANGVPMETHTIDAKKLSDGALEELLAARDARA